jgi:hypothetical protein
MDLMSLGVHCHPECRTDIGTSEGNIGARAAVAVFLAAEQQPGLTVMALKQQLHLEVLIGMIEYKPPTRAVWLRGTNDLAVIGLPISCTFRVPSR